MRKLLALSVALASTAGAINLSDIEDGELCYITVDTEIDWFSTFRLKLPEDVTPDGIESELINAGIPNFNDSESCKYIIDSHIYYTRISDLDDKIYFISTLAFRSAEDGLETPLNIYSYMGGGKINNISEITANMRNSVTQVYKALIRDWENSRT